MACVTIRRRRTVVKKTSLLVILTLASYVVFHLAHSGQGQDTCLLSSCENGGTCLWSSGGTFASCQCPGGFSGVRCEVVNDSWPPCPIHLRKPTGLEKGKHRGNDTLLACKIPKKNSTTLPVDAPEICERHMKTGNYLKLGDSPKRMDHVIAVDKLKLLFCYVPKVACTNWKRLLLILQGDLGADQHVSHMEVHQEADVHLKILGHLNATEVERTYRNYTKIMFVRDPFSRILSAYRDKLEKSGRVDSDRFRKDWNKIIRDETAGYPNRAAEDCTVSFEEFANYLANPGNLLTKGEEEHWRPINGICAPCRIKYDFIGKFENLGRDTTYALGEILHSKLALGLLNSTNFTNSSDAVLLQEYFSRLTPATLNRLYMRYELDFELFGYPSPEYLCEK